MTSPLAVAVVAVAAVYGADDRVDVYQHPDPAWRQLATESVVGLVISPAALSSWSFCDGMAVNAGDRTLAEAHDLCESEPFRDQPQVATCSGTLVDVDLVATAAHCVPDDQTCRDMRLVLGLYYDAEARLADIPREHVFACRRRVVVGDGHDFAIIQLDRAVPAPFRPAAIATRPAVAGDEVGLIGFPDGLPMKLATGCQVVDVVAGAIRTNCDMFAGNSGSGLFTVGRELVGVMAQGTGDYKPRAPGECKVRSQLTEDGRVPGVDSAPQLGGGSAIELAVAALCDRGWPGPICARSAACGDGLCTGAETAQACGADCAAAGCGDGTCDPGEDEACTADCGGLTAPCAGADVGGCAAAGVGAGASSLVALLIALGTLRRRR